MRPFVFVVLAAVPWAIAAPPADGPAKEMGAALQDEAVRYAESVLQYVQVIQDKYVRKVDRAALLAAGVAALYETVGRQSPPGLEAEFAAADELELPRALIRHRVAVGQSSQLEDPKAVIVSLRGLSKLLDPYSGVVRADQYQRPSDAPHFGAGITLDGSEPRSAVVSMPRPLGQAGRIVPRGELLLPGGMAPPPAGMPWRVKTVYPGGPAQRAGLRPGDRIISVNDRPVSGRDAERLFQLLFPDPEGDDDARPVRVTYRRGGTADVAVTLTPSWFDIETISGVTRRDDNRWEFLLDRAAGIGFIRVGALSYGSPDELQTALDVLKANGLRGLILDLRACPGGLLDSAADVVRHFLKAGTIATTRNRDGDIDSNYQVDGAVGRTPAEICTVPLVVLIGSETTGGGELIASSLQDNRRAKIAGLRSIGKGTVTREALPLPDPSFVFRVAIGMFIRPNGKNLHRFANSKPEDDWGVRPDPGLELPQSPDLARQIQDWYEALSLRPGDSHAALPLDDPLNDPLRQFAVKELKRQISAAKRYWWQ